MNAASMQIPYQTYVSKHTKRAGGRRKGGGKRDWIDARAARAVLLDTEAEVRHATECFRRASNQPRTIWNLISYFRRALLHHATLTTVHKHTPPTRHGTLPSLTRNRGASH